MTRVLVVSGGPDAEHDVSVSSGRAIADALRVFERFEVEVRTFHHATEMDVRGADVVVPALHGPWGEGGGAQRVLEAAGIAFVGSGSVAAGLAMDKLATKRAAVHLGIATPASAEINKESQGAPLEFPFVVKPVAEGSSVGLYVVRDETSWRHAWQAVSADATPDRRWMAEAFVGIDGGRELTVPLLDRGSGLEALEIIEIVAASGMYDFEAKYERNDTRYVLSPELPVGLSESVGKHAVQLALGIGARHLARVDFRVDADGCASLLELNTFPGFTAASLLPKAAASAGIGLSDLCALLVDRAIADHSRVLAS